MTKDEIVDTVSNLPGVGKAKAEALYDAGYTTLEKIKAASQEELQEVEGIGPKVAEAIVKGISEAEEAPQEVQVVEERGEAEEETEIVEAEERPYRVRPKPELPDELREALRVREARKKKEPRFRRYHWFRDSKLPDNWRAPRGTLNKQRRGFQNRPAKVKVGYGKPAVARGLHPSGFEEVLVFNANDLEPLDPKTQAARIGGAVGKRKRRDIVRAAEEREIHVLNPGVI